MGKRLEVNGPSIYDLKLTWKSNSLQFMRGGAGTEPTENIIVDIPDGTFMAIKFVEGMDILGVRLDNEGSTSHSLDHRLEKGEACFWAHSAEFLGLGTAVDKFRAWCSGPSASVAYGSNSWHLTASILLVAKRWEFKFFSQSPPAPSTTR